MHVARDWTVIQAFETLAACEATRSREYGQALDHTRQVGETLDDVERGILKFMLDKEALPPSEREKLLRGAVEHQPRLRDALVALAVGTMIHDSFCVASDDPRVRNAGTLAIPPLLPTPEKAPVRGSATVRYIPGRRIVVSARLNGHTPARLIFDTGADRSIIRPRTLAVAGVDLSRPVARGRLRGVAGETEALYFTIDSLAVGEATVQRLRVAAHDVEADDADGLLGRDFLDRFRVAIDPSAGTISLTPR
jgi:hypothetical protein